MKIFLKISLPISIVIFLVLFIGSQFTIRVFQSVYLENTAYELGTHAIKHFSGHFNSSRSNANVVDVLNKEHLEVYKDEIKSLSVFRVNIYDQNGTILYSDLAKNVGVSNPEIRNSIGVTLSGNQLDWKQIDNKDQRQPGFGEYLQIRTLVTSADNSQYVVELLSQQSVIFSQLQKAVNAIIGIFLVAILIILILIYFILKFILINPLIELSRATGIIGSGNLNYKIPEKGNSEISEIGKSLNVMTQKLKDSQMFLNSKIEELEKFNKVMIGRELKMAEMKEEIETLKKEIEQHGTNTE